MTEENGYDEVVSVVVAWLAECGYGRVTTEFPLFGNLGSLDTLELTTHLEQTLGVGDLTEQLTINDLKSVFTLAAFIADALKNDLDGGDTQ